MCLAVPGRIVGAPSDDLMRLARVDFGGVVKEVCLAYVPDAKVDDFVLVHVGFALAVIDDGLALKTIASFRELLSPSPDAPGGAS